MQNRFGSGRREEQSQPPLKDDEIEKIIVSGDVNQLVILADRVGKTLVDQGLTTSQIRNVFGTVRQIEMRWPTDPQRSYREAILLRPKLGYFAEREKRTKGKSLGMETLQLVLEPALILIGQENLTEEQKRQRFQCFVELFEAIVAYHKKHGGK